jgi:muconolactone delta-isomerase
MKILAIEHELPGAEPEAFRELGRAEAARAWDLHQQGVLREMYFRADREEAVLVLECAGVQAAREVLSTLPFVERGLIEFEFIPLRAYPGFARLFAEDIVPQERIAAAARNEPGLE